MGLPGSGKTTLAKLLAPMFNAVWLNADQVRKQSDDWDFSEEGRKRQSLRMWTLAEEAIDRNRVVVADFICPTEQTRDQFKADYTVWMDTVKKGIYEDTNKMFEKPKDVNYHVADWFNDTHAQLLEVVQNYMRMKEGLPTLPIGVKK